MTEEELNNLISQTDLVALVSKYVSLEKKGKNYMGCCPFHNEKTPSFVVSPEKGICNCFGCHKGGNALVFLRDIENTDTKNAIRLLCEFNGVEYKDAGPKKENPNTKYYQIMNTAKDFYKIYLAQDQSGVAAQEYLKSRGLSKEIIEKFEIGLSPNGGDTIRQVLVKKGYLELDIADMSLIDKSEKSTNYHDIFNGRIMFPIKDEMGNTLAFSARIFNNPDKSQPKYINSRETRIFHKGEVLFNLNLAKAEINKKHRVILHEGQMDVIAAYRSGLGEAVCTMGTALTDNHCRMLRRYTDEAIICYDSDKAGIEASLKAIKTFKRNGFKIHLCMIAGGKDPDEYVLNYGEEAYAKYFESHLVDETEYRYQVLLMNKNFSDKEVLKQVTNDAFALIAELNSNVQEEKYLNRLSENLHASIDAVKADYERYISTHARRNNEFAGGNEPVYEDAGYPAYPEDIPMEIPGDAVAPPVKCEKFRNICELRLFVYAKQSRELARKIDNEIMDSMGALSKENQELWMSLINDYYAQFAEFNEGSFVKSLSESDMEQYMYVNQKLSEDPVARDPASYNIDDLNKCISMIKRMGIDEENKTLKNRVNSTDDVTEQVRILDQMFRNKKKKNKKAQ